VHLKWLLSTSTMASWLPTIAILGSSLSDYKEKPVMKSRNILERDSVKNAFEGERKKQEKNSVLSVLSGLALFFVATSLLTMLVIVFSMSIGSLFWLIWNTVALFLDMPAKPIQNFLPLVLVARFWNINLVITSTLGLLFLIFNWAIYIDSKKK
ncbi:hypothetical protein, partial [Streptococcus sanguinis]|uniref:hypothetical protein n=1 Tax=Streptococcus sanguinis TaxID=1305 RepID=UPI000A83D0D7